MSKTRKTNYPMTPFAKRIVELQRKYGYTDQYVIDNVKDSFGIQIATELQTYGKWKSGERLPKDWQNAILAFATFYNVSTDYLLKENEPETPLIGSVQAATGLDTDAVRNIIDIKNTNVYARTIIFLCTKHETSLYVFSLNTTIHFSLYSFWEDNAPKTNPIESIKESDFTVTIS